MEKLTWNFDYKGKTFENKLKETGHGDFRFIQNNNCLYMAQSGERNFLPILIYGLQKIKSPDEAKKDLKNKDWIKGLDSKVSHSNDGAWGYFQLIFTKLDEFEELKISEYDSMKRKIIINNELKVLKDDQEIIILPYNQLSKTIDKLIIASKNAFFRTCHEDLSKMIGYYVSGEFEKNYNKINELLE